MFLSEADPDPMEPRVAFIHDWLTIQGGAEKVLEAALELYPEAPVYTLVHRPEVFEDTALTSREINTSFLNRLPFAKTRYRAYLPLMPIAVEQFDMRNYQILLSTSDAVAHGVLTSPDQLHINYIFTPMRYAWRLYHEYLDAGRISHGLKSWAARLILHYMRLWDFAASSRVDYFLVPSQWIARDVWRVYRRPAEIIYPPVEIDRFTPLRKRDRYYLTVTRLVPNKRVALIAEAFAELGLPLYIVGDGPEYRNLKAKASPNVQVLGWLPQAEVTDLLERARGFVHAAEEDFGIAMVEALAAGCPVVAYGRGGAAETVISGENGILFDRPEVAEICTAVRQIEEERIRFDPAKLHASVERFSRERFQKELAQFVSRSWESHNQEAG